MKLELLVACLVVSSLASGQFIPQPMGYNPDENSDGLIGVADLQGLLALYGQPFNNADSLNIVLLGGNGEVLPDTIFVDENADLVYITQQNALSFTHIVLPEGDDWKVCLFILNVVGDNYGWDGKFIVDVPPPPYCAGLSCDYDYYNFQSFTIGVVPAFFTAIRGHNGLWANPGD